MENEIRYSIAFGNQKHPPSRVMKNITEVEKCHNGEEMYWLSETRIPLYLIKEYEVSAKRVGVPSSAKKPINAVAKLQRSHLKASRKDIFSYLAQKSDQKEIGQKRDKMEKHHHSSVCRLEVLLGYVYKSLLHHVSLLSFLYLFFFVVRPSDSQCSWDFIQRANIYVLTLLMTWIYIFIFLMIVGNVCKCRVCEGKNLRKTRLLTRRRSAVKCWCSVCLGKNLRRRRQLRKRLPERSEKKNGNRSTKVAAGARSKSKRKR